ncbi:DeoR/GlpR family DNA-binding transcription regulator [[Mycoplasma] testudinis]|uniref:DeoR/GlpR family DNA-binding transcription regulator n=1 Tax=[Mycoplasma] testudinis TaxID=33924 RepID=UPI00055F1588|nr:DeoR/GlpR family DNA-binding transcription regulator [[Mycoplasma] testudinis]
MSILISQQILNFLKDNKVCKIADIQKQLKLTQPTLRRHLIKLEEEHLVRRSFGEVVLENNNNLYLSDRDTNVKLTQDVKAKKAIAKMASTFASQANDIFVDNGSNCFFLIDYLKNHQGLQIFTNSLLNAQHALELGFNVRLLGGTLKPNTKCIVDLDPDTLLRQNFDVCFLGVNAIGNNYKLTTPERREGIVKTQMALRSKKVLILAEASKFGLSANYDFTPKDTDINLVTNKPDLKNNKLTKIIFVRE